jgi:TonB family protein
MRQQEGCCCGSALLLAGEVRKVELAQSSGFPLLDRAARDAAAGWVFSPVAAQRYMLTIAQAVEFRMEE